MRSTGHRISRSKTKWAKEHSKKLTDDIRALLWVVSSFYLNLCKSDHREGGITFETAKASNFNVNVSQTPVGSVESPAI